MKRLTNLYRELSETEGSQHIASEFAIGELIRLVNRYKISNILEVGLGIGSISTGILELTKSHIKDYYGVEKNVFCLQALKSHIHIEKVKIFPELRTVPKRPFELIIIDGEVDTLEQVIQLISPNGIIAVEGDRELQVERILQLFPNHKWVHSISLRKNKVYIPFPEREWQGGLKIIFVNPTQKQKLWWAKEKCLTFLKYKYPGRFIGKKYGII